MAGMITWSFQGWAGMVYGFLVHDMRYGFSRACFFFSFLVFDVVDLRLLLSTSSFFLFSIEFERNK